MAREALASRCYNKLSEMMPLVLAHGLTFPLVTLLPSLAESTDTAGREYKNLKFPDNNESTI
jgi:hypothetical protein